MYNRFLSLFLSLFFAYGPYSILQARSYGPVSCVIEDKAPLLLSSKKAEYTLPKNVVQVRAFLQQHDIWSCGYRVLFHALACERALEKPSLFNKRLKKELCCHTSLTTVYNHLKRPKELNNFDIERIAQNLGFSDRLVIIHQHKRAVKLLGDVTIEFPTSLNSHEKKQFIQVVRDQKLYDDLKYLAQTVAKQRKAAYVVCGAYKHWTLYAFIPLASGVKLYMIDSCNTVLAPKYQPTLALLTPFLTLSNKHLSSKKLINSKKATYGTSAFTLPALGSTQAVDASLVLICMILVVMLLSLQVCRRHLKTSR
ncbi:hypothetical protein H0X48_01210 [Candidatus Dependentiae bacterium]|nr:hypothetical protein [Candidatus Dependentiae bacterium]